MCLYPLHQGQCSESQLLGIAMFYSQGKPPFPTLCAPSVPQSASCSAAFSPLSPFMSAQPLSEVQQKQPRDHTLQGAHSEHPTFTCSKVGRGLPAPQKKKGFWRRPVAQLGPGRVGRGGSWQKWGVPPELLLAYPGGRKLHYKTTETMKTQCFLLCENLY